MISFPRGPRVRWRSLRLAFLVALLVALPTRHAQAYIGPGAGFALLSSFFVVFTTIVMAGVAILIWPVRTLIRMVRRRERTRPWIKRLIIVGFDGQDPKLTEKLMSAGQLPNFRKLAEAGCFRPLGTTYPSVSPVAWSSFTTGCHPAKHNIFDFMDRDRRNYLPLLSSTHIGSVDRFLKIGRYRIPLKKPEIRLLRKSKACWTILGEHNIWSTVLRVPITFPPEKFYGAQLSAMCVPDLLGTQGTFLYFTTRPAATTFKEGGVRVALEPGRDRHTTAIEGPPNLFLADSSVLKLPMTIDLDRARNGAKITVGDSVVNLTPRKLSPWIQLSFPAAPAIKVGAICRMMILEMGEHFSLYVSPLNIDPDNPAMPISHPSYYATYLSKRIGHYCTLGLAEDTWALNERVIDDDTFLQLAYDIDRERQDMFWTAFDRLRKGSLFCVFDGTDRIQHMMWRHTEEGHPAYRESDGDHSSAIEDIYRHNDKLVGRLLDRIDDDDVLMVISDHGFTSFRRGVNLNSWLRDNGYLVLKEGADGTSEWLADVDWTRTRAYALGLCGMYLNIEGREAQGIIRPGREAKALRAELIEALNGLRDEEKDEVGINEVFAPPELYAGPYLDNAPDFLIGYNKGYRTSWDCATGVVAGRVFEDNVRAWSGDHCIDPRLVPGIFLCNRRVAAKNPSLIDLAPTALRLFGLEPPSHMDGTPLFDRDSFDAATLPTPPTTGAAGD
ncbi:MAG: alkaline phosphatase family protein [Acidobacteriota bacterium]